MAPRMQREGEVTWIYPIMDQVIAGVERGDKACIAIGIEFIEEDQHFPFPRENPRVMRYYNYFRAHFTKAPAMNLPE